MIGSRQPQESTLFPDLQINHCNLNQKHREIPRTPPDSDQDSLPANGFLKRGQWMLVVFIKCKIEWTLEVNQIIMKVAYTFVHGLIMMYTVYIYICIYHTCKRCLNVRIHLQYMHATNIYTLLDWYQISRFHLKTIQIPPYIYDHCYRLLDVICIYYLIIIFTLSYGIVWTKII